MDWSQHVVLVTGASRGIGEATARALAALGARVILAARSSDAITKIANELTDAGHTALPLVIDVARYADVLAAVETAVERFGRLDVLVNNAGVIEPIARLSESDPKAWGHVLDINTKGVYHGLRAALPVMERQGSGVIVNISSGAANAPLEGWSHYCASKAAALMLTRCADKEYGDKGVRVVGLSPGTVATEMQTQIKASGVNPVSQLDPSVHIPPDWVAKAVVFLSSPAADDLAGEDFSLKTEDGRRRVGLPV